MANQTHRAALLQRLPDRVVGLLREIGQLGDERGCRVYVVGGVVRDLLLGHVTLDLDLTVEGDGVGFARLVADRYRAGLVAFERFATARLVFSDGLKMDIATTRRESYALPGILPTVQSASIEEDLYRRDFTINAIAVQLNPGQFGRLLDVYGGQRDLRARTIRVLHAGSFQDDPTRIFRAIRFEQRLKFRLERATIRLLAEAASKNLIQQLSGPRLQNEILLLLAERDPVRVMARLSQLTLLRFLHRRLSYTANVKRVATAVPKALTWWTRRFADREIDKPIVYFMALSSESSPAVMATMIRRLALSREQARKVSAGGTLVDRVLKRLADERIVRPSQVYRLLVDLPDEALVLALATQMSLQQAAILSRLKGQLVAYMKNRTIKTTLMGRDLQSMGLMPGPQYGTILGKLLEARIDGTITTESDERALAYKLLKNGFSSFVKHETV
ncbi:MAG: hypothetical protein Q8L74_02985 [Nitrospirota bacterium]|nr:hypothetical protein [Nitrospirota bacterium]MDP2383101.1 hypothetical protein [Nitrospirota bacterium]